MLAHNYKQVSVLKSSVCYRQRFEIVRFGFLFFASLIISSSRKNNIHVPFMLGSFARLVNDASNAVLWVCWIVFDAKSYTHTQAHTTLQQRMSGFLVIAQTGKHNQHGPHRTSMIVPQNSVSSSIKIKSSLKARQQATQASRTGLCCTMNSFCRSATTESGLSPSSTIQKRRG